MVDFLISDTANITRIKLDKLLVETDAPYLAPHPQRGTLNHSGKLEFTNKSLAEIWGITPEECAKITEEKVDFTIGSALNLFGGSLPYDEVKTYKPEINTL